MQEVLDEHRRRLEASDSPHLRERAADFVDVQNRVLRNLQQGRAFSRIDENRVVVARNLTAADVLLFSRRGVLGVVLDFGGPTSHVSIMARALGDDAEAENVRYIHLVRGGGGVGLRVRAKAEGGGGGKGLGWRRG